MCDYSLHSVKSRPARCSFRRNPLARQRRKPRSESLTSADAGALRERSA